MELTKEHFDEQFEAIRKDMVVKSDLESMATKADLEEVHRRIDNITTTMATKSDLEVIRSEMVTKIELSEQTKELKNYTDEVAQEIIGAVSERVDDLGKRIAAVEPVR